MELWGAMTDDTGTFNNNGHKIHKKNISSEMVGCKASIDGSYPKSLCSCMPGTIGYLDICGLWNKHVSLFYFQLLNSPI